MDLDKPPKLDEELEKHLRVIEEAAVEEQLDTRRWIDRLQAVSDVWRHRVRVDGAVTLPARQVQLVTQALAFLRLPESPALILAVAAVAHAIAQAEDEAEAAKDELANAPLAAVGFGGHPLRAHLQNQADDVRRWKAAAKHLEAQEARRAAKADRKDQPRRIVLGGRKRARTA